MADYLLNTRPTTKAPLTDIAHQLKTAMNQLKGTFFDLDLGKVNYAAMRNSPDFQAYEAIAAQLQHFDPTQLTGQNERLAFWINIYNVLVIHGIVAHGIQSSVREVPGFFARTAYHIGGQPYSLDVIEHGVLRRNRSKHWLLPRPLGRHDPRLASMVPQLDPRLHCVLVCGASSCPPIGLYQAEHIEAQLDLAARGFVNSPEVQIDPAAQRIELSKIFAWYGRDFGDKADLLAWIARYRPSEERALWAAAGHWKVVYRPYNWNLNQ
jgi:hypothetical protein